MTTYNVTVKEQSNKFVVKVRGLFGEVVFKGVHKDLEILRLMLRMFEHSTYQNNAKVYYQGKTTLVEFLCEGKEKNHATEN